MGAETTSRCCSAWRCSATAKGDDATPEYPDIELYRECLTSRVGGEVLENLRITGPSLLRTVTPKPSARIVIELEGELFLVIHLMIAGRLHWKKPGGKASRRVHAVFEFCDGWLVLTEAGTKKRASLHVVQGEADLQALDPGGLEIFEVSLEAFSEVLQRENHTLKRCLTDPRLFSGIGNAYSDEILHRARLSPVKLSQRMQAPEIETLYCVTREVLSEWLERLRGETGDRFPEKVTAFHSQMAVHGRHREPCPDCDSPVQRIVRGNHETNYCAKCQNGERVLADRALSQLLKKDWPRTLEELETRGMGGTNHKG
ncbi:MAG: formamidopyrimidine-DNA glycosylase [Deltaproteobacteria bacterium]|nr:formamidopyrimidine-DNA glycosylase [Deltaproteobacteria bacterium]